MKWKYSPPVLLILIPWLMILPFLCSFAQLEQLSQWLFEYSTTPVYAAFPVVLVMNVLCAFFVSWDTEELALWNRRIKLWLIPVYLFVLVFAVGVPLAVLSLFAFDALLLLVSSGYGLRALVRAKKETQINNTVFWLLCLCHFCFVADVIAAFILKRKIK